jgi:hypothetical protein
MGVKAVVNSNIAMDKPSAFNADTFGWIDPLGYRSMFVPKLKWFNNYNCSSQ